MKTVVITGASQGIGAELVKQFSREKNFQILALARSHNKLKSLLKKIIDLGYFLFKSIIRILVGKQRLTKYAKCELKWESNGIYISYC